LERPTPSSLAARGADAGQSVDIDRAITVRNDRFQRKCPRRRIQEKMPSQGRVSPTNKRQVCSLYVLIHGDSLTLSMRNTLSSYTNGLNGYWCVCYLRLEQFVAHSRREAFDEVSLPRIARRDVGGLGADCGPVNYQLSQKKAYYSLKL
jgi:hypothetical protein